MPDELVTEIKRKFISRADVKAIQTLTGAYVPYKEGDEYVGWSDQDVIDHLDGNFSYGHYMLSQQSTVKLFAFDLDFRDDAQFELYIDAEEEHTYCGKPLSEWRLRDSKARPYLKREMRAAAERITKEIFDQLELPCAVAYSGHKGAHVYAFTGKISAKEAVDGGQIIMDTLDGFEQHPKFPTLMVWKAHPIFTVELFPKQAALPEGGFGNLMRLPLGKNMKAPKDPTFFVDLSAPYGQLKPTDPIWALTDGAKNPWKRPGE